MGNILRGVQKVVPQVYEYLYEEPLEKAFSRLNKSRRWRDFDSQVQTERQIGDAIRTALDVRDRGAEALPKPRGNWLHRQLLEIAEAAKLEDLSNRQMVEFYDLLCPCRRKHNREEIKKFRQRYGKRREDKK